MKGWIDVQAELLSDFCQGALRFTRHSVPASAVIDLREEIWPEHIFPNLKAHSLTRVTLFGNYALVVDETLDEVRSRIGSA